MTATVTKQTSRSSLNLARPHRAFQIGQAIGKYLITGKLGSGGEGTVYRALHPTIKQERAIKVLGKEGKVVDHDRIRLEASLLGRIQHLNIVRVFDFEDTTEPPFLVMEYVDGVNLSELMSQIGRLETIRACDIILQIADGLRVLSQEGVIHRDIKPANILLTKDGTPKLADLGSGLLFSNSAGDVVMEGQQNAIVGTAYYMAPEQVIAPTEVDHRADIYALGATFYHMLTGQPPFEGRSILEIIKKKSTPNSDGTAACIPPHELVHNIPVEISSLIVRMLAPNADQRFQDYHSLLGELRELRDHYSMPVARPSHGIRETTEITRRTVDVTRGTKTDMSQNSDRHVPDSIATMLRLATAALTCGDRDEARRLLLPWKARAFTSEAYWLLLARTGYSAKESLELADEGLKYLPNAERLRAVREQLATRVPPETTTKKCPFCTQPYPALSSHCGHCGARLNINEPALWPNFQPLNADAIRRSIPLYEKVIEKQPDVRCIYALALAHLNLRQYQQALPHLRETLRLRGEFPGMAEQIRHVEEWVRAQKACRGHIVVVDDSPTVRRMLELKLREFDYHVTCLCDGDEAVAKIEALNPTVILSDINMPGRDGYQVCSWVKSHPLLKKVPVVLFTGKGLIDKIRSKMVGANRQIGKPFNSDQLIQIVDDLVAQLKR